MSRSLGHHLPDHLVGLLDGSNLADKVGLTIQCCTVVEGGWPQLAMISVGEIVALNTNALRLALWASSSTSGRLASTQRCTLALVHEGAAYMIHCAATSLRDIDSSSGQTLRAFQLIIVDVLEDVAPYAELTSGVTYRLYDPSTVVPRWEETIGRLRSL